MSDLQVFDFSEWQGVIPWAQYPSPAVICRLNYGSAYTDKQAAANIAGARARCQVRGWYTYLVQSQAPEPQADLIAAILSAHGGLQAEEFVACDDEEGAGDQAPRVEAFFNRLHTRLQEAADQDWLYSGEYFYRTHLGSLPSGVHRWLAAYSSAEPSDHHDLWQFTSGASAPGVAGKVDCSIFHGSIEQLATLVGGDDMFGTDDRSTLNKMHDQTGALFSLLAFGAWTDPSSGQQYKLMAVPATVDVAKLAADLNAIDAASLAQAVLGQMGKKLSSG